MIDKNKSDVIINRIPEGDLLKGGEPATQGRIPKFGGGQIQSQTTVVNADAPATATSRGGSEAADNTGKDK